MSPFIEILLFDQIMNREVLSVGSSKIIQNLDPFIYLGYRPRSQDFKGFKDHPHRGFEIITFCIDGQQTHEDFLGNKGKVYLQNFF